MCRNARAIIRTFRCLLQGYKPNCRGGRCITGMRGRGVRGWPLQPVCNHAAVASTLFQRPNNRGSLTARLGPNRTGWRGSRYDNDGQDDDG